MSEIQFTAGVSFAADMLDAAGISLVDRSKQHTDGAVGREMQTIAFAYHEMARALRVGGASAVAEKLERHRW